MYCDDIYVTYIKDLHREIETLENDLYQQNEENHRIKENVEDILKEVECYKKIISESREKQSQQENVSRIRYSQDLERDYTPTGIYHRFADQIDLETRPLIFPGKIRPTSTTLRNERLP
jgi:hypothetical protein